MQENDGRVYIRIALKNANLWRLLNRKDARLRNNGVDTWNHNPKSLQVTYKNLGVKEHGED